MKGDTKYKNGVVFSSDGSLKVNENSTNCAFPFI